jgi:NitT/TauT family transport system substrate-binding protein
MIKKMWLLDCIFLLTFLVACAPAAQPTPIVLTPVNVCYSAPTSTQSTVWYALEKGLFKKYGLDVNLFQVSGGSKAITALVSGDVSICQMTANSVINAVAAGKDAVIIAGLYNTFPTVVLARPSITTVDGLRGKILGTSKAGSAAETASRLALQHMGLEPGKDITLLEVGEEPERVAALEAGQVDAIMSSPPYLHALIQKGYNVVFDFGKIGIPYAHTGVATTREFLSQNRPVVVAFMKAMVEAAVRMKTDETGTKEVLAKFTGLDLTANAADLQDGYDNVIKPYLQEVPYPSVEAMQTLLDATVASNPDAAGVKIEQLIDASVIKELENSGFIAGLMNK